MRRYHRILLVAVAATYLAALTFTAFAQTYPARPVRIILPFAAGGGTDAVMRGLVQSLIQSTGQSFILDNRPSDGGNMGLTLTANATPDGYTIAVSTPIVAVNPLLYRRAQYKVSDFVAITLLGRAPALIVVNPSVPAHTIVELIQLAKSRPGELRYGAPTGSGPYLAMEMFRAMAGIDIAHIPYKSSPAAVLDMLSGQIDMVSLTVPTTMPLVRANRLRALAQTGATRLSIAPEIPTMQEAGLKDYNVTTWYMVLAPKKTPQTIVSYLNREFVAVVKLPEVQKRMLATGVDEIVGSSAAEAADFIRAEYERWAKVLKPVAE